MTLHLRSDACQEILCHCLFKELCVPYSVGQDHVSTKLVNYLLGARNAATVVTAHAAAPKTFQVTRFTTKSALSCSAHAGRLMSNHPGRPPPVLLAVHHITKNMTTNEIRAVESARKTPAMITPCNLSGSAVKNDVVS